MFALGGLCTALPRLGLASSHYVREAAVTLGARSSQSASRPPHGHRHHQISLSRRRCDRQMAAARWARWAAPARGLAASAFQFAFWASPLYGATCVHVCEHHRVSRLQASIGGVAVPCCVYYAWHRALKNAGGVPTAVTSAPPWNSYDAVLLSAVHSSGASGRWEPTRNSRKRPPDTRQLLG